ncbi:hypothetical protein PVK64_07500 [Aliivibrio sp. S4TY2]|uniref:hypothetical protein n=1 Tax=unclassified Aliivibrio TaxID=2645654 RepID=UPI002379B3F6|nr:MULTISPECIES: hypothetical protein [unclassified Aliivibrio]MDD9156025.1 hypothetical protein [Aliivibrio sp. S4TY2]MDD9159734.1 hypothetical protein [Aliivibrio sp. S4TY1]MDD9163734.1 hypothetical protein [Aliivibrio sp. S4MY2]MDD9167734.1 hypothetical protein [Aliivibrio sp. S4MY4]MDD9185602.1 hypothetical protein [Aliivibrio sp. S4MY3]
MATDTPSSINILFADVIHNISHSSTIHNIPSPETFTLLITTPLGRQQIEDYINILCRKAYTEQASVSDADLHLWLLPAINALITCNSDQFPSVYKALTTLTVTNNTFFITQKALIYWRGAIDCWHYLLLMISHHSDGLPDQIKQLLKQQLSIGDNSTYYHTHRNEYAKSAHVPYFMHAFLVDKLFTQGQGYVATCQRFSDLPNRASRVKYLKDKIYELKQQLTSISNTLSQMETLSHTLPHPELTQLSIILDLLCPQPTTMDDESQEKWRGNYNELQQQCLNMAITMLNEPKFASNLLKEDLLIHHNIKTAISAHPLECTTEQHVLFPLSDRNIQQLAHQTVRYTNTSFSDAEKAEREWVIQQAYRLFEKDDSHLKSGNIWLSDTVQFFDFHKEASQTLAFSQITQLVLEHAQCYFNNPRFLAYSPNAEWQVALRNVDWPAHPSTVTGYGVFPNGAKNISQRPNEQKKGVQVNVNDYLGITYHVKNPDDYPTDNVNVINQVDVFNEFGECIFSDKWSDLMVPNKTNFVLYVMEPAECYRGVWRFRSWYGEQCLLQQSFFVNPTHPVATH